MTTGSWIPDAEKSSINLPGEAILAEWSAMGEDAISNLNESHIKTLSITMTAGVDLWQTHLACCDNVTLESLLRFFTLAEMHHSQLRADKHNPAIACAKLLRKRGHSLDKSLLQWIRSVSDNRFLPYGPL
ncbi:MAG TPA: hypothetical protein VLA24_00620 [Pseudomonadales bacterium]|nr:hypothetical protein [Pseudomonadales bacterium]